jgi:hypothetical protein
MDSRSVYEFGDSRLVEVLARCCRRPAELTMLDPAKIPLAETVVLVSCIPYESPSPIAHLLISRIKSSICTAYTLGVAHV